MKNLKYLCAGAAILGIIMGIISLIREDKDSAIEAFCGAISMTTLGISNLVTENKKAAK